MKNQPLNMAKAVCLLVAVFGVLVLAGCASTKITHNEQNINGPIPRPGQIWVYDFTANPTNIPADSDLTKADKPAAPPTEEELALGAELGDGVASNLVQEIQAFGMPAALATADTKPQLNDIVIRGYLVSVDPGSRAKRMTLGFGAGGSELTTLVEGYQMTATGLHKLGSGTVESGGGKGPGGAMGAAMWVVTGSPVGLVVGSGVKIYGEASGKATIEGRAEATAKEIAGHLKTKCKEQGWIAD